VQPLGEDETLMTQVLNKKIDKVPLDAVYVGRPSKWGNPFIVGKDGTRDEVIGKYRQWLSNNPYLLGCLHELHGRDLVCFCKPLSCHGDVLLEEANR
jgi:hypothetical protein